jgi:hypothetical protein
MERRDGSELGTGRASAPHEHGELAAAAALERYGDLPRMRGDVVDLCGGW